MTARVSHLCGTVYLNVGKDHSVLCRDIEKLIYFPVLHLIFIVHKFYHFYTIDFFN